jgi:hypothetical protein
MLRHRLATKYDAFVGGLADDTTVDRLCAAMQVRKTGDAFAPRFFQFENVHFAKTGLRKHTQKEISSKDPFSPCRARRT